MLFDRALTEMPIRAESDSSADITWSGLRSDTCLVLSPFLECCFGFTGSIHRAGYLSGVTSEHVVDVLLIL